MKKKVKKKEKGEEKREGNINFKHKKTNKQRITKIYVNVLPNRQSISLTPS